MSTPDPQRVGDLAWARQTGVQRSRQGDAASCCNCLGPVGFHSKDAFARHNGTAPLPVWSSNKQRHRLSRTGNRQLNAALHRIALTQARCYPPARELLERRTNSGDGGMERLRILKRRLPDVVSRAMPADETDPLPRTA